MPLYFRQALVSDSLPENFAGLPIERVNLPCMFGVVLHGGHIAVEAVARFVLRAAGHGGGDENFIAPDDRAGMAEAGNGRLPPSVERFLRVPGDSCGPPFNDAG